MGDYGGGGGGWGGGGGGQQGGWGGGGGYQQQGGFNQGGGGGGGYGGSWGGGRGGNVRPGDWQCPSGCGNVFASKMNCFRCGQPKPEGLGGGDQGGYNQGGYNQGGGYGGRGGGGYGGGFGGERRGPTPRPGDWNCPQGCGLVFASKNACFRCGTPKPEGAGSEFGERQPGGYGGGGFDGGGGGRGPGDITNDEYRSSGRAAQDLADSLDRQPRGGDDAPPPPQ